MQEHRGSRIVRTTVLSELPQGTRSGSVGEAIEKALIRMSEGEIDHLVIGRIPQLHEVMVVNGVKFEVTASSARCFEATLFEPEKED